MKNETLTARWRTARLVTGVGVFTEEGPSVAALLGGAWEWGWARLSSGCKGTNTKPPTRVAIGNARTSGCEHDRGNVLCLGWTKERPSTKFAGARKHDRGNPFVWDGQKDDQCRWHKFAGARNGRLVPPDDAFWSVLRQFGCSLATPRDAGTLVKFQQ